jgi:PEP-CTERM motif
MWGYRVKGALAAGVAAMALIGATQSVQAAGTIMTTDGTNTVYLGVNDLGHLNTTVGNVADNSSRTGLAYGSAAVGGIFDATSPGCFCEGWGVSASGVSGFANVSVGTGGLTLTSFASTASTATSIVSLSALPGLSVKQEYTPVVPGALFKDVVTITNLTGGSLTDVRYVRVMDWDVHPHEFSEFVTIKGTATTSELEMSHNDGFATANPLPGDNTGIGGGTVLTDFTDVGPFDHGAYFRFNFGSLADGASQVFNIFYGAAPSEAAMLAALSTQSVELYSLGQSRAPGGDPTLGTPITYAFAFSGVGGSPVIPPAGVPEPATLGLFGFGLAALAGMRRRKTRKGAVQLAA